MKAVLFDRYGPPEVLTIREIPRPEPDRGEVQVKVAAAAVNPKDALIRAGHLAVVTGQRFPKPTGADYAGTVTGLGAGVRGLKEGDTVYGMLGFRRNRAAAEYVVARTEEVARMPAGLSFEQAASLPLVGLTALQAFRDLGGVGQGSRVAINGASGGVGTVAVQIAGILGAHVTALCGESSAPLVRGLGAHAVFDYRATAPVDLPGRYDCFFDVYGNQNLAKIREKLAPRGRYISTTLKLHNFRDHLLTRLWPGRRGLLVAVSPRANDLATLARWVEAERLEPVISEVLRLDDIADAHRRIQSQHTHGKIVLTFDGGSGN